MAQIFFYYLFIYLAVAIVVVCAEEDKHVFGKKNIAFCPVTNTKLHLDTNAHTIVELQYGQKIYVINQAAASMYRNEPRKYFMSPFDKPLEGTDGYRGLPDQHNTTVSCPITNTSFTVKQMSSPRIMMKHGQFIYFCCMDCMMKFFIAPGKYIVGAGPKANEFRIDDFDTKIIEKQSTMSTNENTRNDNIATIIVATVFLSLCVELIVIAGYILICKKPPNVTKFVNLSGINVKEEVEAQEGEMMILAKEKSNTNIKVERYSDDV